MICCNISNMWICLCLCKISLNGVKWEWYCFVHNECKWKLLLVSVVDKNDKLLDQFLWYLNLWDNCLRSWALKCGVMNQLLKIRLFVSELCLHRIFFFQIHKKKMKSWCSSFSRSGIIEFINTKVLNLGRLRVLTWMSKVLPNIGHKSIAMKLNPRKPNQHFSKDVL